MHFFIFYVAFLIVVSAASTEELQLVKRFLNQKQFKSMFSCAKTYFSKAGNT